MSERGSAISTNEGLTVGDKQAAPRGDEVAPHNYIAIQKPDAETFLPVYSLHSSSILEWECDGDLTVPGSGVGEEGGECFGTVVEQGDRESEMMGHRMMGMGDGKRERFVMFLSSTHLPPVLDGCGAGG